MGMVLSAPMVLVGIWAMATARPAAAPVRARHDAAARKDRPADRGDRPDLGRRLHGALPVRSGRRLLHDARAVRRAGDFTTAPEISQMFGELVGVWLVDAWQAIGRPDRRSPRRDRSRARHADEGHAAHHRPARRRHLRASAALRPDRDQPAAGRRPEGDARRARRTASTGTERIDELPEQPLLIVGNELFDAIPIRQFVKRRTALARAHRRPRRRRRPASSSPAPASLDPALLPPGCRRRAATARSSRSRRPAGADGRRSPSASRAMAAPACSSTTAICEPGVGDTLQAVRRHMPMTTCWPIPARPTSPPMSISRRSPQSRERRARRASCDPGRIPARHGPARARRPAWRGRRRGDARKAARRGRAPGRAGRDGQRCSRCWQSRPGTGFAALPASD